MKSLKVCCWGAFAAAVISTPYVDAFVPVSLMAMQKTRSETSPLSAISLPLSITSSLLSTSRSRRYSKSLLYSSRFIGMNDDEDDEDSDLEDSDDEDDDDDDSSLAARRSGSTARSPFTGLQLDPWDPNPLIKPRPSRYFRESVLEDENANIPDEQLTQTMSTAERQENLQVMRQIRKNDLPDLRARKDHPGWVEANNDLKRRYNKDPWFRVNERLRDAVLLDQGAEKIEYLKKLAEKLGGPPPGIDMGRKDYAVHTEIFDIGISPSRASGVLEREIRLDRAARGRAMMAERRKNLEAQQRQWEDDLRNPGLRQDKEAKERRERTMRRLMEEIEKDNQKKRERAQEILGKLPEPPENRTKAMEKALEEAREDVKRIRRKALGKSDKSSNLDNVLADDDDDDDDDERPKSGAAKARAAAAAEASGGRPRLPGDEDVTRGELDRNKQVQSSSVTTTGPLQVQVTSTYNPEQSDPPMRKHCFQYTIRITNHSPTDTIQLLGRRFEIQTVGSSMKDVVQGEGVTGRTPILKPGETFEYTSTAPLSVRPLGTTIIAARMKGEYRYVVLQPGQETATEEQVQQGGNLKAALGEFHFIFPDDQRVMPFRAADEDDDEDEDDDDDSASQRASKASATPPVARSTSAPATAPSAPSKPPAQPTSTLPGDEDIKTGEITVKLNDSSETVTEQVRVQVTSSYRPERSDEALDKHCFAYNIRITNESKAAIQLVSRRFEIQTIGSANKDVVQGPGVTGRQPILQPGESFEYTSTAPLSVKPFLAKTPVVARMQGEYNFVRLGGNDNNTPISSTPLQAKLAMFHFILPQVA